MLAKLLHTVHFKGEMDEVLLDLDGSGIREMGDLNEFLAAGCLEEGELGTAGGCVASYFLKSENGLIEFYCALKIIDTHAGVVEATDDGHGCWE